VGETRKLAAILVSDVVGYSRLAGADEDRTLSRLRGLRSDLIDPAISAHHGRIVKRTGDGSIVEFRSVVDAVRCAIEMQQGLVERNAGVPEDRRIEFRVGIHLGDVVEESDHVITSGKPGPTIMVIGDSFIASYFPTMLSLHIGHAIWVHHHQCGFDWKLIDKFHPDEVWWAPTERFLVCDPGVHPVDFAG